MKKVKLSIKEQISHMKEKGIKFDLIGDTEAQIILEESNYYFRLKSYAKNYTKYDKAKDIQRKNKYINLDFAYLYELSVLDMYFRDILLQMTITIEHFVKHRLLKHFSENNCDEDGYKIVTDFLNKNTHSKEKIEKMAMGSAYNALLAKKYKDSMPLWVLLELLTFGDFSFFYDFYCKEYRLKDKIKIFFLPTRVLRNAAAHNSCLLHELTRKDFVNYTKSSVDIIHQKCNISKEFIKRKFKKRLIHDFINVLIIYEKVVSSVSVRKKQKKNLTVFLRRCKKHASYFRCHKEIQSTFIFIKRVVDNFLN
ncbi:MAG: Abi family protein [Treponemataceae bacterium]